MDGVKDGREEAETEGAKADGEERDADGEEGSRGEPGTHDARGPHGSAGVDGGTTRKRSDEVKGETVSGTKKTRSSRRGVSRT